MLLGKGRKDESGDFTKGAELNESQIESIVAAIISAKARAPMRRIAGHQELAEIERLVNAAGYGERVRIDQNRRPRPRILHRPGLRSRTHLRDQGRQRPPGALRLGRRRRALRRARLALHGPAGAGDRLLHRRVAPAGRAHRARQARREGARGPGAGHGVRPRQRAGRASAHRQASQRRHPRRTLSRQSQARHRPAAQIRRQARLALRRDPGARRKSQRRRADPRLDRRLGAERPQGSRRILEEAGRGASSRSRKPIWSRKCANCSPATSLANWRAACIGLMP